MFAVFDEWRARRAAAKRLSLSAQPVITSPASLPPTPEGWRIVPHATKGITAYEVSAPLGSESGGLRPGFIGSVEFVGVNATDFHGFPPGTLFIGAVSARVDTATRRHWLTLRFDHKPEGWHKPGATIPTCDFNRLPLGGDGEGE